MSEQRTNNSDADTEAPPKGHVSARGAFEINANPTVDPPFPREEVDIDRSAKFFSHKPLADKYGPDAAREKIGDMVKAVVPGTTTTKLLSQSGPNGMTLVHVWFGPNFQLWRHSHPRDGDCLYYVIAGEIIMGNRTLERGSTIFVPNGQPYKYTAGPAGVELLEFRAGGGDSEAPGMQLDETSFDAIQKIINVSKENEALWKAPEKMGDTMLRQAEVETKSRS